MATASGKRPEPPVGAVAHVRGSLFRVQGLTGSYLVDLESRACQCPDYWGRKRKQGKTCKHWGWLWATEYWKTGG